MKYLVNISEKYIDFDYYHETYKNFYEKHKIKTIIFYHSFFEKAPKNTEFMEFFTYEKYFQILEKLQEIWKENIFYINTFEESLVLETNQLKKDLWFIVSDKFEIFRNKDLQRKFLLEKFPETTVNFQKLDLTKDEDLKIDFPCIIKPTSWVQSSWVTYLKNLEDFLEYKKNFLNIREKLAWKWIKNQNFLLEEFIDWQMYTVNYFINEQWKFFIFPIIRVDWVKKIWIDDFSNYTRISWKFLQKDISYEEIYDFIKKQVETFWLKNTFVHHEFKKTNSWILKTIELNWRIWGYRLELFKEAYNFNMFDIIVLEDKAKFEEKYFYSAFVFYPYKEGKYLWLNKKLLEKFEKLPSFLSINKMWWKVWKTIWFTKNGYSSVASMKIKNENLEEFKKDFEFIEKNYKNVLIIE